MYYSVKVDSVFPPTSFNLSAFPPSFSQQTEIANVVAAVCQQIGA